LSKGNQAQAQAHTRAHMSTHVTPGHVHVHKHLHQACPYLFPFAHMHTFTLGAHATVKERPKEAA